MVTLKRGRPALGLEICQAYTAAGGFAGLLALDYLLESVRSKAFAV